MGIKDILVHLANDAHKIQRLDAAISVAQKFDAHLIGLFVPVAHVLPGYIKTYFTEEMLAGRRAEMQRDMASVRDMFEDRAEGADIPFEWRESSENDLGAVITQARYADLVVASRRDPDSPEADAEYDLAEELALRSSRPLLAIPYSGNFKTMGERILVAWNGSREAARATHDALPFLKRATKVVVLGVNAPSKDYIPGSDISAHIARHGVAVETHNRDSDGIGVSDVLLDAASDIGADMMVLGAYGHSRFREVVLGGVTRSLLHHMTVPVLMSH